MIGIGITRRSWALLLTLVIMLATYAAIVAVFSRERAAGPTAKHGVLDLSQWNFDKNGMVRLNGDWTFYPNQLINPSEPPANGQAVHGTTIVVPGSWTRVMPALGTGTYELDIKVSDTKRVYAMAMESIQMASRTFVNGTPVGSIGHVATNSSYVGKNVPDIVFFNLRKGLNTIVVQVANLDFGPSGGIVQPIYFGYASQTTSLQVKSIGHDAVTFTLFAVMGLYYVGLYRLRRDDKSILFFGLLCLVSAIYTACFGEKLIDMLFPTIPYWVVLRIQTASAVGAILMILLYVYHGFRPYCTRRMVWLNVTAGIAIGIINMVTVQTTWGALARLVLSAYILLMLAYAISVLILGLLNKEEGSMYMLLAAISLSFYALKNNLSLYFGVPLYAFPPVAELVFVLMFALLVAHRFSRAFDQNKRLSIQLTQANQTKDMFLSKTAHEFKTPLHGIITVVESMLKNDASTLTPTQYERTELVWTMAKRLSRLVYDILDFTNLQHGQLAVNRDAVNVRANVEILLKLYSHLGHTHVQLLNRVPENLPAVLADEDRLRQIFTNLLDNALKHTPSGRIEIGAIKRANSIEIFVQDSGSGIDASELPYIFEPFRSLDKDFDATSFGLGLSIVKQLVELQNGEIWVKSVKNEGSCFTFSLPIASQAPESMMATAAPDSTDHHTRILPQEYTFPVPYTSPRRGNYTILVVDDRFSNLRILIDALEQLNYCTVAVNSGESALEYLADDSKVDLVILDLMMPGISGLEVCRAIRMTHSPLELPVVMVTASIQPEAKLAAFAVGANDYLSKPFDMAELKARIQSLLLMKESAKKATDMEVAFLQSQIKPHFLFNVLNTIQALSYTDVEQARQLIANLSNYLRGSFSNVNTESLVPFRFEFELIQAYVEIERVRFKNRVQVAYDIPEYAMDVMVPPLIVQPLVENAIRHGIANRVEGGTVRLRAYEDGNFLVIQIEDDGVGIAKGAMAQDASSGRSQSNRAGVGLLNIKRRLKYAFNTDLIVDSNPGQGTTVTLKIRLG